MSRQILQGFRRASKVVQKSIAIDDIERFVVAQPAKERLIQVDLPHVHIFFVQRSVHEALRCLQAEHRSSLHDTPDQEKTKCDLRCRHPLRARSCPQYPGRASPNAPVVSGCAADSGEYGKRPAARAEPRSSKPKPRSSRRRNLILSCGYFAPSFAKTQRKFVPAQTGSRRVRLLLRRVSHNGPRLGYSLPASTAHCALILIDMVEKPARTNP